MNTVMKRATRCAPIDIPGDLKGRAIFAMPVGNEGDIAALTSRFDTYHGEVKAMATDVAGIKTEVKTYGTEIDALNEKMAALTVMGNGGDQPSGNRKAELKALAGFVRTGDDGPLRQIHATAGMSTDNDPAGGYFLVPNFATTMAKRLHDAVTLRRLSRVVTITSGSNWKEPADIGDATATFVGEREDRPVTASPDIAMLDVALKECYCNIAITSNLWEDVGFDLGGWLEDKITDRFARAEDEKFLTGDGVLAPYGLLSRPVSSANDADRAWGTIQYLPTGAAADFPTSNQADVIKSLVWKLRAPYRRGAVFLMNSNTAAVVDKFKDGTGNYLWQRSLIAGTPDQLAGYPVEYSEHMPDIAANTYPIAFGDFRVAGVVIDRVGTKFLRDPFTAKPHILTYATKRVGYGLSNSEAVKLIKVATT